MKITKSQAIREDWDEVKSWNYKLPHISPKMSVVYAELEGDHGQVHTEDIERIYYIIEGQGEFTIGGEKMSINTGDVITIPPKTEYDYKPADNTKLKVVMFMDLWEN
jgi:mannose-6-phosphate isomerase-like protein (cupin superfamily)